jgi:hypothetical protein
MKALTDLRRILASALLLAACSSDGAASAPDPGACAAGMVADGSGACVPIVCGEGQRKDPEAGGTCKALGWQACPAGFVADASGHGCRDVLPAVTCAAGTMPVLGKTACQPVGPSSCAAGFERDPSGWGCRAVLPAAACTGATKETLGRTSCTPVGDCAAAFPPAGASVFVNATFSNAQLDATHVRTLGEALTAASANAVVAVDAGTYTEAVAPTKSVRIVGRCPAQVTIASAGIPTAGILASGAIDVTVEGVTLTGHLYGAAAEDKASLTLRATVIDANRGGGLRATGSGSRAVVEGSVIRGGIADPLGRGMGIEIRARADLVLRDSVLAGNVDTGLVVSGTGSHAAVERSAVLATHLDANADFGLGMMIRDGAKAEISTTALAKNHETALVAYGKGTRVTATDVVISDTLLSMISSFGRGILADASALELERVTIVANRDAGIVVSHGADAKAHEVVVRDTHPAADGTNGFGLEVFERGVASFAASAVVGSQGSGVNVNGAMSKVTLDGSLVAGTSADSQGDLGFGVDVETGGAAELRGSAVVGNAEAGVYVSDAGSRATLTRTVVADTKAGNGKRHGRGMVVQAGATASVVQSALVGNRDIGVSARDAATTVTFDETVIRGTLPQDSDGTHGRGIEADNGAKITVSRAALLENHSVAIASASNSVIDVRDSWVADTLADASAGGPGRSVTVQAGATMTLLGVVIQRSTQLGLVAAANASLALRSSLVEDTRAAGDGSFGHGVLAYDGALLVVDDVTVKTSAGAALVFAASRGNVNNARITGNAVGIHVQDGSSLTEVAVVPDDPAENVVNVSSDSKFEGNGSRIGSGAIPLPAPLE